MLTTHLRTRLNIIAIAAINLSTKDLYNDCELNSTHVYLKAEKYLVATVTDKKERCTLAAHPTSLWHSREPSKLYAAVRWQETKRRRELGLELQFDYEQWLISTRTRREEV